MRITIPTEDNRGLEAEVSSHFGRSGYFTTVDLESDEIRIRQNQGHHFGGAANPATTAVDTQADAIVCAGLGRKALQYFRSARIEVYTGAEGTVREVCEAFRNGKLPRAREETACAGRHSD
jgi:predicted Fe-Mo cluster-binding NifX family protein